MSDKYCPHCRAIVDQDHTHELRGTRQQRGYTDAWIAFSKKHLRDNPLCVDCMAQGLFRAAKECHIDRRFGDVKTRHKDYRHEARGLCKECHNVRTLKGE